MKVVDSLGKLFGLIFGHIAIGILAAVGLVVGMRIMGVNI